MNDLTTESNLPIFSTFSHVNYDTMKSTPHPKTPNRGKDTRIKRQYRLFSPASKKDQNSTYNRILRLEKSSKDVTPKKKASQLRYYAKTPDFNEIKSRVKFI